MKLSQRLLGFLNRVFDKDPHAFVALRLNYTGSMTWAVADARLTTVVTPAGAGVNLSIDLTQYTLASLAAFIATQPGYSVSYIDPSRGGLSARVLMDGAGNPAQSNGNALLGYSSLLWAYIEAFAAELGTLRDQIPEVPKQLNVNQGAGIWLDEIGSYYGVTRLVGEADGQYGPRIIAEAIRPKGNNVAIERAIQDFTGQNMSVVNVVATGTSTQYFDGSFNHDGTHTYNATVPTTSYGLFDATYAYDVLNSIGTGGLTAFHASVAAVVNKVRDAGTHLRSVSLSGSQVDDVAIPPTDALATLLFVAALADTFTAPTETFAPVATRQVFTDDAAAGTETSSLTINDGRTYNGAYLHDGSIKYSAGSGTTTLEG